MNQQVKANEAASALAKIVIVIVVIVGGTWAWQNVLFRPKTNVEKRVECVQGAGKVYDTERGIIARSSYASESERQYYYTQSANAYTTDMANCNRLYP
jgi:hypothetical protein